MKDYGFVREIAAPIYPASFYCPHGHQWHECASCDELPAYRGSDPRLYEIASEETH